MGVYQGTFNRGDSVWHTHPGKDGAWAGDYDSLISINRNQNNLKGWVFASSSNGKLSGFNLSDSYQSYFHYGQAKGKLTLTKQNYHYGSYWTSETYNTVFKDGR